MEETDLKKAIRKLYIEEGYSCSEAVILYLKSKGKEIPDALIHAVSGLRAGIGGCGCVCGSLIAAVMAVGFLDKGKNKDNIHKLSANLHNKFKDKLKSTCCRALTRKFDFKSKERKEYCLNLIEFIINELEKGDNHGLAI